MKTYASAFLIVLLLLSGRTHASSLQKVTLDNITPANNPPKNNNKGKKGKTTSAKSKEIAGIETKEISVEELGKILNEIDETSRKEDTGSYLTEQLLNVAEDYKGVRYRFGGTSRDGMDCSGFVSTAFNVFDITLPRSSRDMASMGQKINSSEAQKGDLIFFKTGKKSRISHVGIIVEVKGEEIKFIHSSTSKGVIVSSLSEAYYNRTFAQINRVYEKQLL
ncbi:C40 family peptidase [Flavobacterium sp. NKUCC04_CG]|uniref:C40 family peptidase n=1 Tax=Flavobacterium sp. NKUCC04_CG TaxID=2842121 RepID=UPI001C5A919E|nr:C40 family peptidase [Flavobacterium sp. NKUCC04_CG]MBW3518998.1 C40 family peptidase [Flavobacterium sp. NKUCC04_CG]